MKTYLDDCFERFPDAPKIDGRSPLDKNNYDNFKDVLNNGKNIKMKNIAGCIEDESWTLDDCETKDGTTESVGNFYRKGSGLVSKIERIKE